MILWKNLTIGFLINFMIKRKDATDSVTWIDRKFESSPEMKRGVYDIACYKEMLREKTLEARPSTVVAFFTNKADRFSERRHGT
jgi:hypothetical protein